MDPLVNQTPDMSGEPVEQSHTGGRLGASLRATGAQPGIVARRSVKSVQMARAFFGWRAARHALTIADGSLDRLAWGTKTKDEAIAGDDADEAFYTELARDTELLGAMDRFTQMVETNAPEWERSLAELAARQKRYLEQLG